MMHKQIAKILMSDWDPIGVNGVPEAQDEYDEYALRIFSMLSAGVAESEIVNYLLKSEAESMGLENDVLRATRVVKKICSLTIEPKGQTQQEGSE